MVLGLPRSPAAWHSLLQTHASGIRLRASTISHQVQLLTPDCLQAPPDGCLSVEASLLVQRDPAAKAPDTGFSEEPASRERASSSGSAPKAQPQKLPPSVWRAMSGLAGGTAGGVSPAGEASA